MRQDSDRWPWGGGTFSVEEAGSTNSDAAMPESRHSRMGRDCQN